MIIMWLAARIMLAVKEIIVGKKNIVNTATDMGHGHALRKKESKSLQNLGLNTGCCSSE